MSRGAQHRRRQLDHMTPMENTLDRPRPEHVPATMRARIAARLRCAVHDLHALDAAVASRGMVVEAPIRCAVPDAEPRATLLDLGDGLDAVGARCPRGYPWSLGVQSVLRRRRYLDEHEAYLRALRGAS